MFRRAAIAAVVVCLLIAPATAQSPFVSSDQVVDRLGGAADASPDWIDVREIGRSGEGRPLQLAIVTDPDSSVPMGDRVVTLLLTQQHGNEPAGTPAVLDLLDAIAAGDPIRSTLANQILLIQPMGNPDGATANQRANAAGTDLNRDHVHLAEPETQIVHRLFQEYDIHVGVDHHEYSGTGIGSPSPVRLYDYDATVLFPRHGNVREPTLTAAMDLQYDGIFPAAEPAGYTIGDYGVQTLAGIPLDHLAGGPDPGILRNNFGLNNIAGLLVESFVPLGVPNPFITEERRVDVHRVVMEATLQYVSDNAQRFIDAKAESERLNRESPMTEYIEEWPDHPITGLPNEANIRAPMAPFYETAGAAEVAELHGLPAGLGFDGAIHPIGQERGGLLAAIVHPASSRVVAPGTPLDVGPEPVHVAPEMESEDASALGALLLAAALVAVVSANVARRR